VASRALAVITASIVVGIVALAVDDKVGDSQGPQLVIAIVLGVAGMGLVGAVLSAKAPGNPLGPAYQVAAMFMGLAVLGSIYGERGLSDLRGLPGVGIAGWLMQITFEPAFAAAVTAFLLFPDGLPPSPRWRPALWLAWGGAILAGAGTTLGWPEFQFSAGLSVANPFQVEPHGLFTVVSAVGGAAAFAGGLMAVVSVVVRFRRATGEERQQVRWLAWACVVILACVVALVVTGAPSGSASSAPKGLAFLALVTSVLVGLPLATAIAVLRYRLYDLDLVVKKTAIYSIVTIALTGLYLVLLGAATLAGVGAVPAGIVFFLTFVPARKRAERFADRIVYGKRATPFEVLSEFSERVAETYSVDDVLPRMTQLLAATTGAREVRAWILQGRRLRPAAMSPEDADPAQDLELSGEDLPSFGDGVFAFPVTHQGEVLGAVTLTMAANDPMDPSKERLARGIASQVGLALRNVRLVEDLRASRRRIVAAQDERAKALERNIHDGAQQQLVALTVRLRLAEQIAERDPAAIGATLVELRDQASAALEDLRDLARGIYPPLLADKGLFAALEAQARKSAVAVQVRQDIESTVYFCTLEALNNVAKYARAGQAVVSLAQTDSLLTFEVHDDGRGFDTAGMTYGTGLQGMADRLDAVGGRLSVRSAPGEGVTVHGEIPVLERAAADEDRAAIVQTSS
jgi:signal transduction histidine kinase